MSKQITHGEYLLVEVLQYAVDFEVGDHGEGYELAYFLGEPGALTDSRSILLPPGIWQIIGLASSLSETQVAEVVDQTPIEYNEYMYKCYLVETEAYVSATKSLNSLLSLHSMEGETTIILKKI